MTIRSFVALLSVACVLPVCASPSAASDPMTLTVRVYHTVAVPPAEVREARSIAAETFARVGVRIVWEECRAARGPRSSRGCGVPMGPREVAVRLVKTPNVRGSSREHVFGYAHVDPVARRGVLATLFVDRIRAVAPRFKTASGALLGHVLAHEVAHLVLGSLDHADEGVLRPRWDADDLAGARSWMLDAHAAEALPRALASWQLGPPNTPAIQAFAP